MSRLVIRLVLAWMLCVPAALAEEKAKRLELDGLIEPNERIDISCLVPGILSEVLVERGDRVAKEQVVARLESRLEVAAVNIARARVEFGKRKVSRNEKLIEKGLISIHDRDELETEVQLAELNLQDALERLKIRTVRSPVDGVVTSRFRSPGEYTGQDPILTVVSLNPLHVEVIVPDRYYGDIRKGMGAEVYLQIPLSGKYACKVIIVDQVMDAASNTFRIRLELPNPKYRLPAGLNCRVRFLGIAQK